jgi:hypothetical protein
MKSFGAARGCVTVLGPIVFASLLWELLLSCAISPQWCRSRRAGLTYGLTILQYSLEKINILCP